VYPVLFTIPGLNLPIYTFGAMFALAFFLGSLYLERLARKFGDDPVNDPAKYSNLGLWVLLGVVLGGRLLYAAVHPEEFTNDAEGNPRSGIGVIGQVLSVWRGGLVFYGGFILACLIGMWKLGAYKLRRWHAADIVMIAGFLGLGIGRIGCLLVGDDHGRPCAESLPFPIALRVPSPLHPKSLFDREYEGSVIYATQIWMMVNALALAGLGRWILGRKHFAGQVTFTISAIYAVTRGFIEYFRGDDAARGYTDVEMWGSTVRLYTSVKIGLVMLPLSLVMLWVLKRKDKTGSGASPQNVP
jgi:phosphatidylglycerol:prolipoprotein diacylglycerol transferase